MNRKLFITTIALLLAVIIPVTSWALSMPKDLLTYTVSLTPSGNGQLYWNYGKNMEFFLCNGNDSYNQNCRIKKGVSYKFSTLVDRGIVPKADNGWYFDGFYDKSGTKLLMKPVNIDVIRITTNGFYVYDYLLSFDNTAYKNYTEKRYQDEMKKYLRNLYGVSRYKVMFQTKLYSVPPKTANLYPRFKEKTLRKLTFPKDMNKMYGDPSFIFWPDCPKDINASYKSSNTRVLSVDKVSGLGKIKGEGVATITITLPETERYLAKEIKVTARIKPISISILSARKKDTKTVELKWKPDTKSSGCEIEIASDTKFSKIIAKKTVSSAKTAATKITIPKNAVCKAIRIRAYKRSCGEKLYGAFNTYHF